ncbi:MAG: glycoside hydrolase [Bacteroidota bacterium]
MKAIKGIFGIALILSVGCADKKEVSQIEDGQTDSNTIRISIDPGTIYQTIESFGASDAWTIQFVGKNWQDDKKETISELLFSTEVDAAGNPKGIGLTSWRFNIGGGSAEQGESSNIKTDWRRSESFIDENENYDWNKQLGQQWFLEKAKAHGVVHFTAFVNSPPVVYTKNGKAYSEDGNSANIASDNYEKYADFLVAVLKNVEEKTGVHFDYLSPFNEPQWEWRCCKQEGSPWNNDELAAATRVIDAAITREQLSTKIEVTDAGQLNFLYGNDGDARRNDQLINLFSSGSDIYIGDFKNVAKAIAGHSYFTTYDINKLVDTRKSLASKIQEVDPSLKFVMSEYCVLEDNEEIKGAGLDLGIDPALYTARVIHADMILANAVSWQWWLAVSPYEYKDGLVYIDKDKGNGNYYESKLLWGFGNYARFIRPGMQRVEVERSNQISISNMGDLLSSAYASSDELVVVVVNQIQADRTIVFDNLDTGKYNKITMYETSAEKNLELTKVIDDLEQEFVVPKRSIVTFLIQ